MIFKAPSPAAGFFQPPATGHPRAGTEEERGSSVHQSLALQCYRRLPGVKQCHRVINHPQTIKKLYIMWYHRFIAFRPGLRHGRQLLTVLGQTDSPYGMRPFKTFGCFFQRYVWPSKSKDDLLCVGPIFGK